MARRRMIDPTIWDDPDFGDLSRDERLFYIGCFSNADDEGRLFGDARYLRKAIFAYDDLSLAEVEVMRDRVLATFKKLKRYIVDDKEYLYFENWREHQTISHPTKSQLPPPSEALQNDSGNALESIQNHSGIIPTQFNIDKYSIDKNKADEFNNGAGAPILAGKVKYRAAELRENGDVISNLAKGYAEGMGWESERVVKTTVHSSWAEHLLAAHKADYTPDDIKNCTAYKRQDPWWKGKEPPLKVIVGFLPEWIKLGKPLQWSNQRNNSPPTEYRYSPSELERMDFIQREVEARKVGKTTSQS